MFRFNQKKVNSELDELKKLLAITKGAKTSNKSVSASFLREDVDLMGNPNQPPAPAPDMGGQEMPQQTQPGLEQTDDTKEIEKAITNSTIITSGPMTEEEGSEQVVKGYVSTADDEKGLYFQFSTKENSPMIQSRKAIVLDDNLVKSIQQIAAYFGTWKQNTEK
jgi:hypothetical protein